MISFRLGKILYIQIDDQNSYMYTVRNFLWISESVWTLYWFCHWGSSTMSCSFVGQVNVLWVASIYWFATPIIFWRIARFQTAIFLMLIYRIAWRYLQKPSTESSEINQNLSGAYILSILLRIEMSRPAKFFDLQTFRRKGCCADN